MKFQEHPLAPGDIFTRPGSDEEWIVIDAGWAGGGTGHGPHDVYPDGWRVTIKLWVGHAGEPVRYYQDGTGCFVGESMLIGIKLTGRAVRQWVRV